MSKCLFVFSPNNLERISHERWRAFWKSRDTSGPRAPAARLRERSTTATGKTPSAWIPGPPSPPSSRSSPGRRRGSHPSAVTSIPEGPWSVWQGSPHLTLKWHNQSVHWYVSTYFFSTTNKLIRCCRFCPNYNKSNRKISTVWVNVPIEPLWRRHEKSSNVKSPNKRRTD